MTVTTVIAALQTINDAVTGIDNAPTDYPGSIETADCPMAITWPGPAESGGSPAGANSQREYQIVVYVQKIGSGRGGMAEGWNNTKPILQALIAAYLDPANVILVSDGTYNASIRADLDDSPVIDRGFEVIAYPPPATGVEGYPHYFGVPLSVTVKETW